ncbi:MAG TPA: cysteine hydrolase [Tahibacter sp.]|uniref:cysteine hydrolase family protein n=1 Tax=Tahibacter sp. TaxID=2056211 RepID=UPI002C51C338|nr:cysteine hydrolase [Tahibacter sp.]HSX60623.1 cysteine hydrolase [Tahibacter sp.]
MPASGPLKHPADGNCAVALLLVDFISDWDLPERAQLVPHVLRALPQASRLLAGARRAGVPVIFANDNFGQWRSDFDAVFAAAMAAGGTAGRIASAVAPHETDYRVLKPKHSAFLATPLDLLLQHLGVSTIVLCGVSGNQCVMTTAVDAHMRDYRPVVVHDASASRTAALHRHAMDLLKDLGVGVVRASSVRWTSLRSAE